MPIIDLGVSNIPKILTATGFFHELSIFFILIQDVDTCVDKNYRCPTKCVSTGIPNTCNIPNEPASHGRCVTAHQLNNGVNNCADGSDEGILIPTFFLLISYWQPRVFWGRNK